MVDCFLIYNALGKIDLGDWDYENIGSSKYNKTARNIRGTIILLFGAWVVGWVSIKSICPGI
jgi:hypothetical protein